MKYGYKEVRTLSNWDLRAMCIAGNWYEEGTNDEYSNLLNRVNELDNITTDDIVEIAMDIMEHSNGTVKYLVQSSGLSWDGVLCHLMYLINEACNTHFEEC